MREILSINLNIYMVSFKSPMKTNYKNKLKNLVRHFCKMFPPLIILRVPTVIIVHKTGQHTEISVRSITLHKIIYSLAIQFLIWNF